MPLDDALARRMREADFWPAYLFDDDAPDLWDEDAEEQESQVARFELGGGFELVLDVTLGLEYVDLALRAPGRSEPVTVGWDDQAHFHPHVMSWPELDLLCRAVALHDPELRHPGPMLALLCRFAFRGEDEDLDAVTPPTDAAFGVVRPGPDVAVRPETRDWHELRTLPGVRWVTTPGGHPVAEQPDEEGEPLYSLRVPDSAEFPFAAWAGLLARAREAVAAVRADPALADPAVRDALARCAGADGHGRLGALAEALAAAGFAVPVVLRAIAEPVHRTEACWAVEVLADLPQGELTARWFGPSPLPRS
ncbi:hypothetical protein SRB5_57490 [Streptomyces sp. RB5]|uniref:Uncharacterized protein n=1 Tax=Streptomyces smaragdinus TaxID=2585196 RepID=A0A7K0CQ02_9ACTN|nr:hypothetical protein [Streptomyces smaragdinus]MQY15566.1 hypothetical protein [Streptomyces smaragdinus]